jgi:hypothetical protein
LPPCQNCIWPNKKWRAAVEAMDGWVRRGERERY